MMWDLEQAARAQGQEMLMFPSTLRQATIGGFVAGGYAGIGSIRHGILKDTGNVTRLRVVTIENAPRVIDLLDADIQKVHHAFGTASSPSLMSHSLPRKIGDMSLSILMITWLRCGFRTQPRRRN